LTGSRRRSVRRWEVNRRERSGSSAGISVTRNRERVGLLPGSIPVVLPYRDPRPPQRQSVVEYRVRADRLRAFSVGAATRHGSVSGDQDQRPINRSAAAPFRAGGRTERFPAATSLGVATAMPSERLLGSPIVGPVTRRPVLSHGLVTSADRK
jgi:hypothetical protein